MHETEKTSTVSIRILQFTTQFSCTCSYTHIHIYTQKEMPNRALFAYKFNIVSLARSHHNDLPLHMNLIVAQRDTHPQATLQTQLQFALFARASP